MVIDVHLHRVLRRHPRHTELADPVIVATGWAVRGRDGLVVADFAPDVTEHDIWQIALGWPPPEDIEWNKQRGARAFRCELREIE